MKLKSILTVSLALAASISLFAQNEEIRYPWFAGVGGGINITYDGQKWDSRVDSHRGLGIGSDIYFGKWLTDLGGFRIGWQGLSGSDTYDDFGKVNFNYGHGDVLFRVHKNIIPYVHAGFVMTKDKLSGHKGKAAAGGIGIMFPIHVNRTISIVPDFKYAAMNNTAFSQGKRTPSSLLSGTIGLAFNFGKARVPATEYVDREVVKYVDREKIVHDTIYIKEKPDVIYMGNEINDFLKNVTLFEFDSYEITREARAGLRRVVDWMNEYPSLTAKIEGHTDSIGTDEYNQKLSENRAKAIYDYLVKEGIAASRLAYIGYGESRPVATNDTAEGRAQNRRIEMTFTYPENK